MARRGGVLGLDWENVAEFYHKTKMTRVFVSELEDTFIHWLRGRGALTKKLANNFTNYVRSSIYSQRAFQGMTPLSPEWQARKEKLELSPEMGIARGTLASSIRPINTGYRKYRVGIPRTEENAKAVGTIKNVSEYAIILEKGSDTQPPRPFFSTSFLRWIDDKVPYYIRDSIVKDMNPTLMRLYQIAAEYNRKVRKIEPEDLYTVIPPDTTRSEATNLMAQATGSIAFYNENFGD